MTSAGQWLCLLCDGPSACSSARALQREGMSPTTLHNTISPLLSVPSVASCWIHRQYEGHPQRQLLQHLPGPFTDQSPLYISSPINGFLKPDIESYECV